MNRNRDLAKNTVIIAAGKICTQFLSFFLLPLYTYLLSVEEYGIFDLLNTYVMLLVPLVTLQIEEALFRFLIDVRNDYNQKKMLVSTALMFAIIQCVIYAVIFLVVAHFIQNEYKYFLLTNVIVYIMSNTTLQFARGLGDNLAYAFGGFITAITIISFNIIFLVIFKMGATGMFMSIFIAHSVCFLFVFFTKKIYSYISIEKVSIIKLKELLRYSIPLVPNAMSWWILNTSDRVVVSLVLGVAANGVLSIAHKFSSVYIMFYNIFNLTWIESAAVHINDDDCDEFFSNIISIAFRIFSAGALIIIACMPFLFPVLINEKFIDAYYQIPIFMLSAFFNIVLALYSVVYVAMKLTRELFKTTMVAGIINVVLCGLLIKNIGLYAASIASAVSYGSMMIYRYFDTKKYIDIQFSIKVLASTVVMFTFLFITYYKNNRTLNGIALLVTILYSIYLNREIICDSIYIFKNIMRKYF